VPDSKKWYAADEQGSSWVSDGWHAGLQDAAPALQVALGLVLLVSGIGKARDRHSLVAGALRHRLLGCPVCGGPPSALMLGNGVV